MAKKHVVKKVCETAGYVAREATILAVNIVVARAVNKVMRKILGGS